MICVECGRDIRPCNMGRHRERHEKDLRARLHAFLSYLDIEHHITLAVHAHPVEMVPCPTCMDTDHSGYGQAKLRGCLGLDIAHLTPRQIQVLGNGEIDVDFRRAFKEDLPKCPNCEGSGRAVGEATWIDELQAWSGRLPDVVRDFVTGDRLALDSRTARDVRAICEGSIP